MPKAGLEPARSCLRQILSLLRLPIPPLRRKTHISTPSIDCQQKLLSLLNRVDADFSLIATFALKCNFARDFGEKRIVLAASDV